MRQGLREELNRVIFIMLLATAGGLISGYLFQAWAGAIGLYSCWLLFQTRNFYLWIEQDNDVYPPDYGGIWGDIFDIVYRFRHRNNVIKHQLEQQLEGVQASMNALQNGVVSISDTNYIQWWNPEAGRLLGFKEGFDNGKPIHNLIRHPKFIDYLQNEKFNSTVIISSPVSSDYILEIQMTVFGNQQKLLMVQDISRLVLLEQMRKDFVANVSHELRTPLTVINGYLEMLDTNLSDLPEKWRMPIKKISDQSSRMTEIVEDLSILSRLDNQQSAIENNEVQIKPLLMKISKDAKEIRSDIEMTIQVKGEGFTIEGSESELQSCFSNIIFNAVKYAKAQSLNLSIELEEIQDKKIIRFIDNGIGIDPIHIPRLTERFYRADKSHSRKTGGTGLGLAIVKHILKRHGALLKIQSKLGTGSTFICIFSSSKSMFTTSEQETMLNSEITTSKS